MPNGWPTPQGGFAGGFESGLGLASQFSEMRDRRAQRALQLEQFKRQQRKDELEIGKLYKERLHEAADELDPQIRTLAFKSIFKAMERDFGGKMPEGLAALSKNPEQFKQALQMADEQGLTMKDMWTAAGDPLLFSSALLSFGKVRQQQATRRAQEQGALVTALPGVQPEAGDPNAKLIESLQAAVVNLNAGIANASTAGADPKVIDAMTKRKDDVEKQLVDLIKTRGTAETQEGAKPIAAATFDQARQAYPDLVASGTIYPGMTLNEYRAALRGRIGQPSIPSPTPAPVTPPTAPTAPQLGRADVGVPAGRPLPPQQPIREPSGRVIDPIERAQRERVTFEQQAQFLQTPLPEDLQREYGAMNYGQAVAKAGRGELPKLISPVELARRKAAAENIERLAGKQYEKIWTDAETARGSRALKEEMLALVEQAGETGPVLSNVRLGAYTVAKTLFPGFEPEKMAWLQMLEAGSLKLGIADLTKVGGNDTERELMTTIRANPGILKTKKGNLLMLMTSIELEKMAERRIYFADQWLNAPWNEARSLSTPDPTTGKTFNQAWADWRGKPENSTVAKLQASFGLKSFDDVYKTFGLKRPKQRR